MALHGLKNRKSPGVDNIHPEYLKHLGQTAKANKSPEEISNYQPISLTRLMSKTMERMTYNRLNWYLESHSLLAEEQAAFRKFTSTAHHVTLLSQAVKDVFDSKQVLTAIPLI
ncbi:hypothetical protein CDAR_171681 [Caerostris darwini]|uniref:Reverse transcriptase n=1 Tax=Caerostris darwini TaxID=1538125 RepID=A0AAV4QU84_9ARAC|nr:hypothetical protein CDAR_171681 [Caerostris darwini]